jgi:o-succinylbenzoate---CoA ligase
VIDWNSLESHIYVNPKIPQHLRDRLKIVNMPILPAHIWLSSSGTTAEGVLSLYGLRKSALIVAAEGANYHLEATAQDVWLNVLPHFHVGGIAIFARAFMTESKVHDRSHLPWSAESFHSWCENERVTLTSLVPTHLWDLVEFGVRAPQKLRAIVVGGAALDEALYLKARELGFNCLPSYGMTECGSQVATAALSSLAKNEFPDLQVLPHLEVMVDEDGRLGVKSDALFTMKVELRHDRFEPLWRAGDWYFTKDRASVRQVESGTSWIKPLGRSDDEIKISGELVDLTSLNNLFRRVSGMHESVILAQPEARRGHEIVAVLPREAFLAADKWVANFNTQVLPVARVKALYFVDNIPRTELGKVRTGELRIELGLV